MASCYKKELMEVEETGVEEFGTVYKCIKRLERCIYAIKRSTETLQDYQSLDLHQVNVHVVLSHQPHMVHYCSSFAEKDHVIDQSK